MATASKAQPGGLKGYFAAHRTLTVYPTGFYRWWMLILAVMATIVLFFEFGFSALLPLWLPSLHFTVEQFSWFLTAVVFLSGISAMFGGPLADRHGRVVVIDSCIVVMILLDFREPPDDQFLVLCNNSRLDESGRRIGLGCPGWFDP